MVLSVKVSTKYQVVVPSEARHRLGIEPGDRLDVRIEEDAIVMRRRPTRASDRLRGLGRGRGWYDPDPDTYLRRLREELEGDLRERAELVHRHAAEAAPADRDRQLSADLRPRRRPSPG